jgi:hypothetical protein
MDKFVWFSGMSSEIFSDISDATVSRENGEKID